MKLDSNTLEETVFDLLEQFKELLSPKIWGNVLLDCTKNEILILFYLYRRHEANMTQLADYMNVPLNTATGIVSRMEHKNMILRERNPEDKRVVTIVLSDYGNGQFHAILQQLLPYGQKLLQSLTPQELQAAESIINKVLEIVRQGKEPSSPPALRKIEIT